MLVCLSPLCTEVQNAQLFQEFIFVVVKAAQRRTFQLFYCWHQQQDLQLHFFYFGVADTLMSVNSLWPNSKLVRKVISRLCSCLLIDFISFWADERVASSKGFSCFSSSPPVVLPIPIWKITFDVIWQSWNRLRPSDWLDGLQNEISAASRASAQTWQQKRGGPLIRSDK